VRTLGIRRQLDGDVEQTNSEDQERDETGLGDAERHKRIPEHEQAVAGHEEDDRRKIGEQLGVAAGAGQARRQEQDDRQRADRNRQVSVAAVGLVDPGRHRPDRQHSERDFDGKQKHQEDFSHCGRIAYLRIFQGRTARFVGLVGDKTTATPVEN